MACKNRIPSNTFGFLRLRRVTGGTLADLPIRDTCSLVLVVAAPSGLTDTVISETRIDLSWTNNSGVGSLFTIEISTSADFLSGVTEVTGVGTTTYAATGLTAGTTYYFRVKAVIGVQSSPWSNTATDRTWTIQIAYYKFENDLLDSSGREYDGSFTTVATTGTFTDDKDGNPLSALLLDGINDKVNVNIIAVPLQPSTVGAIMGWVRIDSITSDQRVFASFRQTVGNVGNDFLLFGVRDSGKFTATFNPNQTTKWSFREIVASAVEDEWVHVALVHNGTTPIFYKNGVDQASNMTFTTSTDKTQWMADENFDDARIGNISLASESQFFPGAMKNFRFYNVLLSASDVLDIYNEEL